MAAFALVTTTTSDLVPLLLLYVGPDVLLPLTSALAAIAGVALMFWQRVVGAARSVWRVVFPRRD